MIGEIYRKILKKNKKGLEYKSSFEIQNAEKLLVILSEKLLVLVFEELYLFTALKYQEKCIRNARENDYLHPAFITEFCARYCIFFILFLYSLLSLHLKLACSEE